MLKLITHPADSLVSPRASEPAGIGGILCSTNLSDAAGEVVKVAGLLAARLDKMLMLLHASREDAHEGLPLQLQEALAEFARTHLAELEQVLAADRIRTMTMSRVGPPASILAAESTRLRATLLVIPSSSEQRRADRKRKNLVTEVAEAATVPTMVVRSPAPLLKWLKGERPLRVMVCADLSLPSEAALLWLNWFQRLGTCQIVVSNIESFRLPETPGGFFPSVLMDEMALKTAHLEERMLKQRVRSLLRASKPPRVTFEKGWGMSDAHLIRRAVEERADLLVVGTHSRNGWHRIGYHSISRGVLNYAPMNVVCVPACFTDTLAMNSSKSKAT